MPNPQINPNQWGQTPPPKPNYNPYQPNNYPPQNYYQNPYQQPNPPTAHQQPVQMGQNYAQQPVTPQQKYSEPMDKKKKIILGGISGTVLLIIIIVAAIIFSNGTKSTITNSQSSVCSSGKDVELVWQRPVLPGQDNDIFESLINNFEDTYTNVSIELNTVEYGSDYYSNLIKSLAKRTGPDIFAIRNDDLPAYQEIMTPIATISGQKLANYRSDFTEFAVRDTMIKDSVYGVTLYTDNLQLYYNDTILQQSNISVPAQSWDDILKQIPKIRKLQTDKTTIDQYAIALGTGGLLNGNQNIQNFDGIFSSFLLQNGENIYDYQSQESILATSTSKDLTKGESTLKNYLDYADKLSDKYTWNTSAPNSLDAFVDGKLGYYIGYKEDLSIIKERNPRLNFGVTELPQINQSNKKTSGKFFMDGLSKGLEFDALASGSETSQASAKKACAEEFLYYLTTTQKNKDLDAGTIFASQTALPSARRDIIESQINGSDKTTQVFAKGSLYATSYYKPDVVATEKVWSDLLEDVQIRRIDQKTAWENLVERYERLVKKGPQIR